MKSRGSRQIGRFGSGQVSKPVPLIGTWGNLVTVGQPTCRSDKRRHLNSPALGGEPRPTLLHTFREDRAYHIGYVFLPEEWLDDVDAVLVEVGDPQDWGK